MTRTGEREVTIKKDTPGGKGIVRIEHLLSEEEKGTACGLFADVTIEVGATLGYHEHHGETETYFITKGVGIYRDNDVEYEVKVGDVVFCDNGSGHGLANTGSEELKFTALILNK